MEEVVGAAANQSCMLCSSPPPPRHSPPPRWHLSSCYTRAASTSFILQFYPISSLSSSRLHLLPPLPLPPLPSSLPHPPSLNWESGRAVEIALTRALPGYAIHLLFYYAAPGLPGRCRSICHRPRSLITGICHRLASLLMLSSPP